MKVLVKAFLNIARNVLGIIKWFVRETRLCAFTIGKRKDASLSQVSILANGPTLTDELNLLDGSVDMAYCMVNDAVKTDLFWRFRPRYYVFADPLYFTRNLVSDNNLYIDAFNRIDWNMIVYVPVLVYGMVKNIFSQNQRITVKKIPESLPDSVTNNKIRNFFFHHKMACPPVQNVVVGAIYSLIMEGYSNLNLLGVGHSWLSALAVNDKNQVCLRDVHYYDKNVELKPWYKCSGKAYKMHEVLRDLAQTFDSYHQLRIWADSYSDIKIVNYTEGSFIDAFERNP